jgi:excisionase family DNA binding protein
MTYEAQDETEAVRRVEQALREYGPFVSVAEAARQTGVPLPTLADAVRHQRIPALHVQKQRWLVRISAVRGYFSQESTDPRQELDRKLKAGGYLDENYTVANRKFRKIKPIAYEGKKPLSEWIVEERR